MDVDHLAKWTTMLCSIAAAILSGINLWFNHRGKIDMFRVGLYPVRPDISPGTVMHVVSCSDYPIQIVDYGFIYEDGEIESLPLLKEAGDYIPPDFIHYGNTLLTKRGDYFESGLDIRLKKDVIGAFARSITQSKNKLYFLPPYILWKRIVFLKKRRQLLLRDIQTS